MPDVSTARDALTALALASTRLHPDDIPTVVAEEAAKAGLANLTIYLADLEQRVLVPFGGPPVPGRVSLAIDATVAGRAYRTERPVVASGEGGSGAGGASEGTTTWLPLVDSAERMGVISVVTDTEMDDEVLRACAAIVDLIAEMLSNKADYGDGIARARRVEDLTMAAEMRWAMLPPLTFTGRNLGISAILEPAYSVAGDTFDYAVNGDIAHVAIIDAVGHGLEAARIANLAIGAYRHSRRRDLDHAETYAAMDAALADEFGSEKFATAQLATLGLSSGCLRWLNAGHPPPMIVRGRHRVDLVSEVSLPVGLAASGDVRPQVAETFLEPGDVVLFFSDGVVEGRSAEGEQFGRERLADLLERAVAGAQTPAETLRLLGQAVVAHQPGPLQDDATLLILAWHGHEEQAARASVGPLALPGTDLIEGR